MPSLRGSICIFILFFMIINVVNSDTIAPESVIPAYSATCIFIKNVGEIANAIKTSQAWQEVMENIQKKADENSKDNHDSIKFAMANIWDIVSISTDRIAIVITDPTKMDSASIIIDLKNVNTVLEIAQKILSLLSDDETSNIIPNAGTYLDVPYGIIKPEARFAFIDNLFVLAPDQDSIESIIDIYRDKEPSILEDPKFNAVSNKLTPFGEVLIYVNSEVTNPITEKITGNEPLKMLGTGDVKAMLSKIDLLSSTRDMEFYMYSGDKSSIMASMFSQTGTLVSPHIIPLASADIFYAFNAGNLASMWDKLMSDIGETLSEEEFLNMQSALSGFEMQSGLNVKNDILESLTGEIGVAFAMPKAELGMGDSMMQKGMMMFFGISNKSKATMCIERIFADKPLQKTLYKGVEISYIQPEGNQGVPLGFIFADELLVLSNMKSLMAIIDDESPIATSQNFAEIGSRLSQPSSGLFYVDLKKISSQIPPPASQSGDPEKFFEILQKIGSLGGSMTYDGQGYKTIITGNKSGNWLEIIGNIINMSMKEKEKGLD